MHVCVKCGKKYASLEKVSNSCSCGATVFIYSEKEQDVEEERSWLNERIGQKTTDKIVCIDVANVRILQKGVYEIDIEALLENPLVVRDHAGVYYIRLPDDKKKR